MLLFPNTIQPFLTSPIVFMSVALWLIPAGSAIAGDAGSGNKTNVVEEEVLMVSLPLKIEDAIINAAAGSGDNEQVDGENRHQINRPVASESVKTTSDKSDEDISYLGAGLVGAAIGAGLGAWSGSTGSNYYGGTTGSNYYGGTNNGVYQPGYYPEYYGGIPYAPVGYPGIPVYQRPPTVYRPPRPDSFYPGPGPAYGDYFDDDAADGLDGFGGSYPGYYSELLSDKAPVTPQVAGSQPSSIATVGGSPGQKNPPTKGGTSGYPIDWSAVAEAYYQDVSSRTNYPSSHPTETESIFVSDSYPLIFDDY